MADHSEPSSNVWIVAAWNRLSRNEQAAMMILYFVGAIMTALVCVWAKWHIIEWRQGQRPGPRRQITDRIATERRFENVFSGSMLTRVYWISIEQSTGVSLGRANLSRNSAETSAENR
ncbi:hypothetical protein PoMZ_08199 [Pyricularia oryzae]|uniref:Uncharacterized protein n=1 Tax=Pyricularia oryzae TaxID=318829 RepID=A0A4P7NH13_PYROR|nr:hypothetical protein PoMZ_08199 [Pyricularia oryzae]